MQAAGEVLAIVPTWGDAQVRLTARQNLAPLRRRVATQRRYILVVEMGVFRADVLTASAHDPTLPIELIISLLSKIQAFRCY